MEKFDRGYADVTPFIDEAEVLPLNIARTWSLVLKAKNIPHKVVPKGGGWRISAPISVGEEIYHELLDYERENEEDEEAPKPQTHLLARLDMATLAALSLLALFHPLTYREIVLFGSVVDWVGVGAADAAMIMGGELWRTVTALTLHGDGLHLLGNVIIGGFFALLLFTETSAGPGWFLIVASGALGNLVNSWFQGPGHVSLGSSTAIFGALGVISGLNGTRWDRNALQRWLVPVGAGFAILSLIGMGGERTDIGAHIFGFVAGFSLGVPAGFLLKRRGPPTPALCCTLGAAAALTVGLAWGIALLV